MAKWDIVSKIDEIQSDLENLYIKKNQKNDMDFILEELQKVQLGVIEYMKDKSKFDMWVEKHISKEVHPNADI